MRFSLFFFAALPSVLTAAAPHETKHSTAVEPAPTSPAPTAGNGTVVPLVHAVVKVTLDVSCGNEISRFRPNCDGSCHFVSAGFGGLITNGNGVYGVNCKTYADYDCSPSTYLGETGNHVSTSTHCYPFSGARSYICYYRC
ncbi:hypothetical protein AURDEDRAFT_137975 [Auricularia subglabra TFB-10046 SS5]|nr:hypothetical protein AURDEDRAFT_137975 [Auricularia subglabra TFB-10046 SS5]